MSYYPIPERELLKLIGLEWLKKANALKRQNCRHGGLLHSKPTWSKIKPVYTDLQGKKCVFCDLKLLSRGSANADLEHFRPKGKIAAWPRSGSGSYGVSTGAAQNSGYYWLAYNPFNYASSCKHCNSALKRCAFPILGTRGAPHDSISQLNALEKPLLLFPFGPAGDNPANYLSFIGVVVTPKSGISPEGELRARATIDFFDLNHTDIIRARMEIAITVFERCRDKVTAITGAAAQDADMTLRIKRHYQAEQSLFANWYFDQIKNGAAPEKAAAVKTYTESCKFMESIGI
jgi:hypothetical protein